MKKIFLALTVVFQMLIFSQTATPPAIGDGSEGDPYQIATLNNLYWISASTANWNKHYIQMNNINASETSSWFSGAGWTPIGNNSIRFQGSYNGDNHTIDSLYLHRSASDMGFFGVTSGATIENLGVKRVDIAAYDHTGALVGKAFSSTVRNCFTSGNVWGQGNGTDYAYTGGFIGTIETGTVVSDCYSLADVAGPLRQWGGFASAILNSTVTNCYSAGIVSSGLSAVGGFAGSVTNATVNNCFWDKEASTQLVSAAGTGKTTAEMKLQSTFTNWDFTTPVWKMVDKVIYPYLSWQPSSLITFEGGTSNGVDGEYLVGALLHLAAEVPAPGSSYYFVNWTDDTEAVLSEDYEFDYTVTENDAILFANYETGGSTNFNLRIRNDGVNVILEWDPLEGAAYYQVFSSSDPYGIYQLDGTGTFDGTSWTTPMTANKRFYIIVAYN